MTTCLTDQGSGTYQDILFTSNTTAVNTLFSNSINFINSIDSDRRYESSSLSLSATSEGIATDANLIS
jgi:hypothetical protein